MDVFKRKTPLEKAAKDLREPFAQPDVRRAAMAKLLEIASPESYEALLMRFSFNANGNIADEEEKRDLVEELVKVGEPMVDPIKRFVRKEKAVGFPLQVLSKILDRQTYLAYLVEALRAMEPLDHRTTEAKRAIVSTLGEMGGVEEAAALVPYLGDHHDDVQSDAIEAIERLKNEATYAALIEVCCSDKHSPRIQRRAATALENLAVWVKDQFERFNAELKGEYLLGKKGTLAKKGAATKSA
jgi:hypothetical protein